MAQVSLRDKASGVQTRFFLTDDARLDVRMVLDALEAKVVKLIEKDGSFSVLQRRPDGLSYNQFRPDDVLDVSLVFEQDNPQHQASASSPQNVRGYWNKNYTLDVDWSTTYLEAALVDEIDADAHVFTKLYTWDEFKSGKLTTGGDPRVALCKYPCPSLLGSPEDEGWDQVYTASQQNRHMKTINSWLQLPVGTSFGWLGNATKSGLKKVFEGVAIGSKNNEVLASDGRVRNAVLGVNIYKKLAWPGLFRAHLEYLLWGVTSDLPFMQLITDMHTGGQFYVCKELFNKQSVIWIVVMNTMEQVKECFQQFGATLPRSLREFSEEQLVELKPPRAKFPYPGASRPSVTDCC